MKLFSDCNDCIICVNSGHCLAGHGDDNFTIASKDKLISMLDKEDLSKRNINLIKGCLLVYYDFNYDTEKELAKRRVSNKEDAAFSHLFDRKGD